MDETIQFLLQHGYALLFAWVLAEQLGLPLPAIPLLLAGGALAGSAKMNVAVAISSAIIAAPKLNPGFNNRRYRPKTEEAKDKEIKVKAE